MEYAKKVCLTSHNFELNKLFDNAIKNANLFPTAKKA